MILQVTIGLKHGHFALANSQHTFRVTNFSIWPPQIRKATSLVSIPLQQRVYEQNEFSEMTTYLLGKKKLSLK